MSVVSNLVKKATIEISEYDHEASANITFVLHDGSKLHALVNGAWSPNCDNPMYAAGCDAIKLLEAFDIKVPDDFEITVQSFCDGQEDAIGSMTAQDFRLEDQENSNIITRPDVSSSLACETYGEYQALNGTLTPEKYQQHLNIFLILTQQAYTGGATRLDRDQAWAAWESYCKGAKLAKNEPSLIFQAVDQVFTYS